MFVYLIAAALCISDIVFLTNLSKNLYTVYYITILTEDEVESIVTTSTLIGFFTWIICSLAAPMGDMAGCIPFVIIVYMVQTGLRAMIMHGNRIEVDGSLRKSIRKSLQKESDEVKLHKFISGKPGQYGEYLFQRTHPAEPDNYKLRDVFRNKTRMSTADVLAVRILAIVDMMILVAMAFASKRIGNWNI